MTPSQTTAPEAAGEACCRWSQVDTAEAYACFCDPCQRPASQRQYAQEHGLPRSTLGYWLRHDFPDYLDPGMVHFFRCPAGLAWLRRLLLALLVVFHHGNACGLRAIGHFLELVGLDHFVASSYGALHALDDHLQGELVHFGQQQRQELAPGMPAKDIAVCLDENFHGPHICLVGIEPVSGFILVETYADSRDSATWATAIDAGLEGLAVNCVLFTGDQATGLVRCARVEFRLAYQPDLFHLQRDLARPILAPLARPVHQAEKGLHQARQKTALLDEAEQAGPLVLQEVVQVVREELQAEQRLAQAKEKLEQAAGPIREISRVYHPFDRDSGQPVSAEQMQARLAAPLQQLAAVVEAEALGQRAQQALAKAGEWVVVLAGGIGWFWTHSGRRLEALDVSDEAQRVIQGCLLASHYWEMASGREKDADERKRLKELAGRLKEQAWAKGGALAALSEAEREQVERVARECAGLFCRSSSCVEGRNGRLSLFHHGQTRLSNKRLQALTVIHNYVLRRADGTTAAERFFGQKHPDAFSWLLQRMPELPRPAAKRRHQPAADTPVAA
jgi:hypothetical protein